jgi:hypothetical protein
MAIIQISLVLLIHIDINSVFNNDYKCIFNDIVTNNNNDGNIDNKNQNSKIIPNLYNSNSKIKILVERLLYKFMNECLSEHSKISCLCISIIENNNILLKYFISVNPDTGDRINIWKEKQFDKLIEILRKNRNHWHPMVKSASGRLFDIILNYGNDDDDDYDD